jgi:hypothetical protein
MPVTSESKLITLFKVSLPRFTHVFFLQKPSFVFLYNGDHPHPHHPTMGLFPYLSLRNNVFIQKKTCVEFQTFSHSQTHQSTLHYLLYIININHFEPLQPTITGEVETPVAVASVEFIDPREPVLVSLFHNIGYCT